MPDVSAFDQRMRAEVWKIRADTASTLTTGVDVDPAWIKRNILRMTDEQSSGISDAAAQAESIRRLDSVRSSLRLMLESSGGE